MKETRKGCETRVHAVRLTFSSSRPPFRSFFLSHWKPYHVTTNKLKTQFDRSNKTFAKKMNSTNLLGELRGFEKGGLFDLGHPLLNRITESFIKAAGIGAIQAVSREAYFTAVEGTKDSNNMPEISAGPKKHHFPNVKGETNRKSLEAMVKNTSKESLQWGLAAGIHSGLTYGLKEARGAHDWKNSAVAGAITGVALALTSEDSSHEQIVQCAITGAAISTAANLLAGIF